MLILTSVPGDFIGRDRTTSTLNFSILILSLITHHQQKKYTRELKLRSGGYNERILNVEHGSFCPLVYSVTGGSGPEARTFLDYCLKKYRIRLNRTIQMLLIFKDVNYFFLSGSWFSCV